MAAIVLKLWHGIEFMLIYVLRYSHDDVIKSKHFPRYWPFVRWIHWRLPGVVTRIFDVFFDLRLNKRLSKPSRHLWFETPSHSLWRHCNTIKQSQFASVKYCLAKALHITYLCRCFPCLDSIQCTLKVLCHYFNTLRMRQTQTNAFSWMNVSEFRLKFHLSLFLKVQLTIFHHWSLDAVYAPRIPDFALVLAKCWHMSHIALVYNTSIPCEFNCISETVVIQTNILWLYYKINTAHKKDRQKARYESQENPVRAYYFYIHVYGWHLMM